jgi:hypothetical protein
MNPSTPPPPGDPREQAAVRIAERRARVRRIRNRTAAGSAAAFVAVFGGLYGQLTAGHDPGLAKAGTSGGSSSGGSSNPPPSESTDPSSSGASAAGAQAPQDEAAPATEVPAAPTSPPADQTWSSPSPAPVTTSQS